jgi:hypothetical protein
MRFLGFLTNLVRGAAVALVAAYVFAVGTLLLVPGRGDLMAALIVSFGLVYLALWFVLPAGILLGYAIPEFASVRSRRRRLTLGAALGIALGALGGILLSRGYLGSGGALEEDFLSEPVLAFTMAAYTASWSACAVWLAGRHRERRDV